MSFPNYHNLWLKEEKLKPSAIALSIIPQVAAKTEQAVEKLACYLVGWIQFRNQLDDRRI